MDEYWGEGKEGKKRRRLDVQEKEEREKEEAVESGLRTKVGRDDRQMDGWCGRRETREKNGCRVDGMG